MSKAKNELPENIQALDAMFDRYMRKRNIVLEQIGLQIGRTMIMYMNTQDSRVAKALVQNWLRYYDLTPDKVTMSNQMLSYFDLALMLIERDDVLTTVLANPDTEKLLAGMCMARAYKVSDGYCISSGLNIQDLLQRWRGKAASEATVKTLQATVDYLYGPAVWTLYSNDVKYERQLVKHFMVMDLPLPPVLQTTPYSEVENKLPFDLS